MVAQQTGHVASCMQARASMYLKTTFYKRLLTFFIIFIKMRVWTVLNFILNFYNIYEISGGQLI